MRIQWRTGFRLWVAHLARTRAVVEHRRSRVDWERRVAGLRLAAAPQRARLQKMRTVGEQAGVGMVAARVAGVRAVTLAGGVAVLMAAVGRVLEEMGELEVRWVPRASPQQRLSICCDEFTSMRALSVFIQVVRPAGIWSCVVEDPACGLVAVAVAVQVVVEPHASS
eukprot:7375944-Prymnesium_polylepis.4